MGDRRWQRAYSVTKQRHGHRGLCDPSDAASPPDGSAMDDHRPLPGGVVDCLGRRQPRWNGAPTCCFMRPYPRAGRAVACLMTQTLGREVWRRGLLYARIGIAGGRKCTLGEQNVVSTGPTDGTEQRSATSLEASPEGRMRAYRSSPTALSPNRRSILQELCIYITTLTTYIADVTHRLKEQLPTPSNVCMSHMSTRGITSCSLSPPNPS